MSRGGKKTRVVALASGDHICSTPRVVKEADALSDAGCKVHVLGGAYAADLKQRDLSLAEGRDWEFRHVYDLTGSAAGRIWLKVRRKFGLLLWSKARLANSWQIFYGTGDIARAVARLDADLTIIHWETALPAGIAQLKRGKAVGIDLEDWFSEDLLPSARAGRPIAMLAAMEKQLLSDGVHSTCTSEAMAGALVERYQCRRPLPIRNVFPSAERNQIDAEWKDRTGLSSRNSARSPRSETAPVSIFWYSQTIGPGRGLEELFHAAALLRGNFEIHLRGDVRGYETWFDGIVAPQVQPRVHLHQLVSNEELLSRIAEHDVGFAGERAEPPSRDLTITNKFFQYLQGGLAVVASETAGQKEAAQAAGGAVMLHKQGDTPALAANLQRLINDRSHLNAMRAASWEAGERLGWENEAPKLVESVERALEGRKVRL
jgi:glycosyltransferase involved in cell wall biosynthesis